MRALFVVSYDAGNLLWSASCLVCRLVGCLSVLENLSLANDHLQVEIEIEWRLALLHPLLRFEFEADVLC